MLLYIKNKISIMSYKLTEETKQWIVSNYTAVGIIEAMEREGGEKALDIAKRLATKAGVLAELITNPGRIKFVGDVDTKPVVEPTVEVIEVVEVVEPAVKVIEPAVKVIETVVEVVEPVVEVTEPIVTVTEPVVEVVEPVVEVTEPVVEVVEVAPKAKTSKKK